MRQKGIGRVFLAQSKMYITSGGGRRGVKSYEDMDVLAEDLVIIKSRGINPRYKVRVLSGGAYWWAVPQLFFENEQLIPALQ